MDYFKLAVPFFVWFLTLLILDYVWLWYITKDFLIREFWNLITVENWSIKINLLAWVIAWFFISAMIVVFVTLKYDTYKEIMYYWALLWFFSYAMYDLTNLAFLNNYSIKFTLIDIVWWTFACSIVALNSYYFYNLVK
jgi:uncharacterized membrane protein